MLRAVAIEWEVVDMDSFEFITWFGLVDILRDKTNGVGWFIVEIVPACLLACIRLE